MDPQACSAEEVQTEMKACLWLTSLYLGAPMDPQACSGEELCREEYLRMASYRVVKYKIHQFPCIHIC